MSFRNTVTIRDNRFIFTNQNNEIAVRVKLENNEIRECVSSDVNVQKAFRKLAKKYRHRYASFFERELMNYHLKKWIWIQSRKVILTTVVDKAGNDAFDSFKGKLFKRNVEIAKVTALNLISSLPDPFPQSEVERVNNALKVFFKA